MAKMNRRKAVSSEEILEDFLPYRLSTVAWKVAHAFSAVYASEGINRSEWVILASLFDSESIPLKTLSAKATLDVATASRAIQKLKLMNFVHAETDPNDRRGLLLSPTKEGMALFRRVVPNALKFESELLAPLTAEQRKSLMDALTLIESSIDGRSDS